MRTGLGNRWLAGALAGALAAGFGLAAAGGAGAATLAPVPFATAAFDGYATGTVLHADALQASSTGPQLLNVEEGFSGASTASAGTASLPGQGPNAAKGTIVNEMGQVVQPLLPDTSASSLLAGDKSFGRGSGLEIGAENNVPDGTNQLPVDKVQVSAPPTQSDAAQVGPVSADPVAYASLLEGEANARWGSGCVLGAPISSGVGEAADLQLLDTGSANPDGTMSAPVVASDYGGSSVAEAASETVLAPQTTASGTVPAGADGGYALESSTVETIAPVTLLRGTANQITIIAGGPWVLSAVAGGVPGSAFVHYGPAAASPQTPVLTVLNASGQIVAQVTAQQLLSGSGLDISVPGVAEIAVGEAPRAIGGAYGSAPSVSAAGTLASAAVDVARVTLLAQTNNAGETTLHAADIRIGHMEASAAVPAGGIGCSLPVSKTATPPVVHPGESFTYTIGVTNPCLSPLDDLVVHDTITPSKGIVYSVDSESPAATSVSPAAGTVTGGLTTLDFTKLPAVAAGKTIDLSIRVTVADSSAAGVFTDTVSAAADCASGSASGLENVTVGLAGALSVATPRVAPSPPGAGGGAPGGAVAPAGSNGLGSGRQSAGPGSGSGAPGTGGPALPFTGADVVRTLAGAMVLLGAGGLLIFWKRRRLAARAAAGAA